MHRRTEAEPDLRLVNVVLPHSHMRVATCSVVHGQTGGRGSKHATVRPKPVESKVIRLPYSALHCPMVDMHNFTAVTWLKDYPRAASVHSDRESETV